MREYTSEIFYNGSEFKESDDYCFNICKGDPLNDIISNIANQLKDCCCVPCEDYSDLPLGEVNSVITPQYRLVSKLCEVQLQGVFSFVEGGGFPIVGTLPVGNRPPANRYFICRAITMGESDVETWANLEIDTSGVITILQVKDMGQGDTVNISLDQVRFNLNN